MMGHYRSESGYDAEDERRRKLAIEMRIAKTEQIVKALDDISPEGNVDLVLKVRTILDMLGVKTQDW
jgi:hypothetical protein